MSSSNDDGDDNDVVEVFGPSAEQQRLSTGSKKKTKNRNVESQDEACSVVEIEDSSLLPSSFAASSSRPTKVFYTATGANQPQEYVSTESKQKASFFVATRGEHKNKSAAVAAAVGETRQDVNSRAITAILKKDWDILLGETLEIWAHKILYLRRVYPSDSFRTIRWLGIPCCKIHRHPDVLAYIRDAVKQVAAPSIQTGVVDEINLVIHRSTSQEQRSSLGERREENDGDEIAKARTIAINMVEKERFSLRFTTGDTENADDNFVWDISSESSSSTSSSNSPSPLVTSIVDSQVRRENDDPVEELTTRHDSFVCDYAFSNKDDDAHILRLREQQEKGMRDLVLTLLSLESGSSLEQEVSSELSFDIELHVAEGRSDQVTCPELNKAYSTGNWVPCTLQPSKKRGIQKCTSKNEARRPVEKKRAIRPILQTISTFFGDIEHIFSPSIQSTNVLKRKKCNLGTSRTCKYPDLENDTNDQVLKSFGENSH